MSNIEFVLSLTPKQINKFIEFNTNEHLMIGMIWDPYGDRCNLVIKEKEFKEEYTWNNDKWIINE